MGEKSYCIIAGNSERPEIIERGIVEKNSGQTRTAGEIIKTHAKRGVVGIPNYTEAWGIRLDIEGNEPKNPLTVTDKNYGGQIKALKWNDPKGCVIVCRYLVGYNSLDKQYQDIVLGATQNIREDNESAADAFFLRMQSGDNFYDPETEPYLVQMFNIHYLNESSVSKNPESQNYWFKEKTFVNDVEQDKSSYSTKFNASKILNEAVEDNTGKKLRILFRIVSKIPDESIKDDQLFKQLESMVNTEWKLFLSKIDEYKKNVSNLFEKADAYQALDLTKHGTIVAGKDKKEIVAEGVPGKGKNMLDWILANFLDEKSFNMVFKLTQITDTFK